MCLTINVETHVSQQIEFGISVARQAAATVGDLFRQESDFLERPVVQVLRQLFLRDVVGGPGAGRPVLPICGIYFGNEFPGRERGPRSRPGTVWSLFDSPGVAGDRAVEMGHSTSHTHTQTSHRTTSRTKERRTIAPPRLIFQTITAKMNLSEDLDLEDFIARPEKISAADISAICQEAGMQAVRRNRYVILHKDFEAGWKEHAKKKDKDFDFYSM